VEFSRVGDLFQISMQFTSPALVGSTVLVSAVAVSGCTIGAITQASNILGGLGVGWARATVTTTSRTCSAVIQWAITIAGNTNIFYSGFTSTTKEQTIEQWPALAISQSGAWAIADDANGWAVHQDPLSGTIEVEADDIVGSLDGMATAIQSLDRLRIQVCGSAGDVEAGDCEAWDQIATFGSNDTVNNTLNAVFPDKLHLCGPPVPGNASACPPVAASAVAHVDFPGDANAPNLTWLALLCVFIVLIATFWWLGMAYALGWSIAAFIAHVVPGLPFSLPIALVMLVLGVALQYLNERRGERSQAPEDRDTSGVV